MIRRRCGECGKHLGYILDDKIDGVSDGICSDCIPKVLERHEWKHPRESQQPVSASATGSLPSTPEGSRASGAVTVSTGSPVRTNTAGGICARSSGYIEVTRSSSVRSANTGNVAGSGRVEL